MSDIVEACIVQRGAAEIGRPHAGMLLMEKVVHGVPLTLPDLPDEQ